jgi:hypothetical protein
MKLNLLKRNKSSITQIQINNNSENVVQTQVVSQEVYYQKMFQGCQSVNIEDNNSTTVNSSYKLKNIAKNKAKRSINKRFKVGGRYFLHLKSRDGSRYILKEYVCKKFIYSLNDNIMNIVIMQQVAGEVDKKFTLNKNECKQFHIKFEPGLEVYSMDMNWITEKKK